MSKVSAVVKSQGKNCISRIQNRLVRCKVSLGTAVRLHVYMIVSIENFSPHVAAVFFQLVYKLSSTVVTCCVACCTDCRVTFCIFPGQTTAARCKYRFRAVVFGSDELHIIFLAKIFFFDKSAHYR